MWNPIIRNVKYQRSRIMDVERVSGRYYLRREDGWSFFIMDSHNKAQVDLKIGDEIIVYNKGVGFQIHRILRRDGKA